MLPFTLTGKQPELQDQSEQFDDSHDWDLTPQKRAWVPVQRFCDENYNNNNEVLPEKAAHFLQDDILQRTRTVWIKQGSEFEGAVGCTRHDPRSNPFAADAEALSKRSQIRTVLAQNDGGSVQNFTVPVAKETVAAYLKALDLRWYQQCSGGKAPVSQRPSFCQPVQDTLEAFRRRLIIDTIKVNLDEPAQSAQLNAATATYESPPQLNDTMSVKGSRDQPFSLMEITEDYYDSGSPTSDEDEDLPVINPISHLRQEEWPQEHISLQEEQIPQEEEEQDLESMRRMRQEGDPEAQLPGLDPEELDKQLPSDLAPEIIENLSCIQGEVSEVVEEEVPLPLELELQLCEQEELTNEEAEEGQEVQLSQGALNEEPSDPVLMVLDPFTQITEEDATLAFHEFLREGSSSRVQTPVPLEMDIGSAGSSSSETQTASPLTPPEPDLERVKLDGQALMLTDVELDHLRDQERRGR
ncbi:hypothetical protein BG006_004152 [Podila minutissima]|uniref:Uncharacterized protein n=1 Tax=Podila minutissima TaxID=64525 RepID=A0A9P5VQZ9_9FUNG|nr:hypothetical protein BG006_004152 [Podila minutissima]